MDTFPSSSGDGDAAPLSPSYEETWIKQQDLLRRKLIIGDDSGWALGGGDGGIGGGLLRYVGGVDVSFVKDDPSVACGALVVIDLQQRQQQRGREAVPGVVHESYEVVRLGVPYVPGFLAFREVPILLRLLEKTKNDAPPFYPQLLMVDGNGILHPRVTSCGWSDSIESQAAPRRPSKCIQGCGYFNWRLWTDMGCDCVND